MLDFGEKMLAQDYLKLKEKCHNYLLGGLFFLFILLCFFVLANYMLAQQIKANSYMPTKAVVVDYVLRNEIKDIDHSSTTIPTYYDIVEYEVDGKTYRKGCDTPSSSYTPPDNIGNVITVYVNRNNPNDVIFKNATHISLIIVLYVVCVSGFIIIAFLLYKAHTINKTLKQYS